MKRVLVAAAAAAILLSRASTFAADDRIAQRAQAVQSIYAELQSVQLTLHKYLLNLAVQGKVQLNQLNPIENKISPLLAFRRPDDDQVTHLSEFPNVGRALDIFSSSGIAKGSDLSQSDPQVLGEENVRKFLLALVGDLNFNSESGKRNYPYLNMDYVSRRQLVLQEHAVELCRRQITHLIRLKPSGEMQRIYYHPAVDMENLVSELIHLKQAMHQNLPASEEANLLSMDGIIDSFITKIRESLLIVSA